jgi:BASS family bile acid:Na+ symporter
MAIEDHIENIRIEFSDESLVLLNICLGFIMFGVALGIEISDFQRISKSPKSIFAGAFSQFILLPFFTFVLIYLAEPHPSFALGMILVAACPGGNVSNFISSVSNANTALSISLTALATLLTPLFTPLNFNFWASTIPETKAFLQSFSISFSDIIQTVLLLLVFPLIAGLSFKRYFPGTTKIIHRPIKILSFLILIGFIGVALAKNFEPFKEYLGLVFLLVLIHNTLAFLIGFGTGKIARLPDADVRAISIETGIQNSGLGLIIIFTFFAGQGGMAIVAAWWGIWHIIAGIAISRIFILTSKRARYT